VARDDDWTSVVDVGHATVDRGEGLQIVAAWLAERGISMDNFELKDVRVDQWQMRGGRDPHRYTFWVRTSSLPRSAED
jgi:hypothetical protein